MKEAAPTRREALAAAGGALAWAFAPGLSAQEKKAWEPLNRLPRMVQERLVARVRELEAAALARKQALRTREDAEAWVRDVRARILASFGPLPERTPLNPRTTRVVERDAYRIENLIFESRPGFLVTANLYVPKGGEGRRPGVVGTCGHSSNGKAAEAYQSFAQGLARLGFVVLIFDPIGQGERLQYADETLKSRVGVGVQEHLLAGNQQFLVGEFFGTWRAWDGIRALDLLLERPEVDPAKVCVTGNSGGGTMTTWLAGLDPRWAAAAPSCFVTTFRHNLENELSADTEQCPPRALALGLDHEDFLSALAPKPVIVMGQEKDYFDARGVEEAHRRMKRLWSLFGAEGNAGMFIGPTYHGYSKENREAMYRWFAKAVGAPPVDAEPALTIEKDETLWCTPRGQVAPLGSRPVFAFTREKADALAAKRPPALAGDGLVRAVRELLRLPAPPAGPPPYRIQRAWANRGYPRPRWLGYWVETEPGILASVIRLGDQPHHSRPPRGAEEAILYVSHHSADAELREEALVRDAAKAAPETPVYAVDPRGIGDSRPGTGDERSYLAPYGNDYHHAITSIMLDEPVVGRRTHDLLRVLDWMAAAGHARVTLLARGWGAIPAAFAALLSPHVSKVALKHAPTSYDALAKAERYGWPLSSMLPGVLERFDLPDVYRALEAKGLELPEPRGPEGA